MFQGQIRALVALIILGGHLVVFLCGLLLGTFGPLTLSDTTQTILMATPVLGVTGAAALIWVLRGETGIVMGAKVSAVFATVTIMFPLGLLFCILIIFYAVYKQLPSFGPEQMKISLGGVETFFGMYLGTISDTLFGKAPSIK